MADLECRSTAQLRAGPTSLLSSEISVQEPLDSALIHGFSTTMLGASEIALFVSTSCEIQFSYSSPTAASSWHVLRELDQSKLPHDQMNGSNW